MKKYLRELPSKSRAHKKSFSLIVSALAVAIIFVGWMMVKFGGSSPVADANGPVNLAATVQTEPDSFANVLTGFKASWQALTHVITNGGQ